MKKDFGVFCMICLVSVLILLCPIFSGAYAISQDSPVEASPILSETPVPATPKPTILETPKPTTPVTPTPETPIPETPIPEAPAEEELKFATEYLDENAYCYLTIPSVGIVVPCYWSLGDYEAQAIVDAENSACILPTYEMFYIADHVNQGFDAIKSIEVGDKMYLTYPDSVAVYECIEVNREAKNMGDGLYDINDNLIYYDNCVICYTCNAEHPWVTAVCFTLCS